MNSELAGKSALVTGGTDGIGKEVARGLAQAGLSVMIIGRDGYKGNWVEKELRDSTGNPNVRFIPGDVGLVRETGRLADQVTELAPKLHILVHSAGIVRGRHSVTEEGVETNFAVNYLGRFALTMRLLPQLQTAGDAGRSARIVVISGAAQGGSIHFNNVNLTKNFSTVRMVRQFAHANDVFTVELARRLAATRAPVTVNCLKIGVVKTNIRREFPLWMKWLVPLILDPLLGQTPQEAAAAALKLSLAEEFEGLSGALFLKIRKFRQIKTPARVEDPQTGRRLFDLSDELIARALRNPRPGAEIDAVVTNQPPRRSYL